MKFKNTLLIILLFLIIGVGYGQQKKQVIFIWDVTQSMKGDDIISGTHDESKNIFAAVQKGMVDIINNFGKNELVDNFSIYPFRTNVERKLTNIKNTSEGRKQAIDFINNYSITPGGNTNICGAMNKALESVTDTIGSIIYLFTDGQQNKPKGCLFNTINNYCKKAQQCKAYTFFISLNANYTETQKQRFEESCIEFIEVKDINEKGMPKFIYLIPRFETIRFNQKSGMQATQLFDVVGPDLPPNFSFSARIQYNVNDVNANFALEERNNIKLNATNENVFKLKLYDENLNIGFNDIINGKVILENPIGERSYIKFAPESFNFELTNKEEIYVNILGFGKKHNIEEIIFGTAKPKDTLSQNLYIECNEAAINSNEYIDFQIQDGDENSIDTNIFSFLLNGKAINKEFIRIHLNSLQAKPTKNKLRISIVPKGKSSKEFDGEIVIVSNSDRIDGLIEIQNESFNDNFNVEYEFKYNVPWGWIDWLYLFLAIVVPIILLFFILTRNNMPFGKKTFKYGQLIPEDGKISRKSLKDLTELNLNTIFDLDEDIILIPIDYKHKRKNRRMAQIKCSSMIELQLIMGDGEEEVVNTGYRLFNSDTIIININNNEYKFNYTNLKNRR